MSVTIEKPKVDIAPKIIESIKDQTEEMGQVVVHISIESARHDDLWVRIWPTTFLYDNGSSHVSDLVHAENIVYYPLWQPSPSGDVPRFTLIFSGLPRSCTSFDLIERCTNQSGAFEVRDIARNESDVYYLIV